MSCFFYFAQRVKVHYLWVSETEGNQEHASF